MSEQPPASEADPRAYYQEQFAPLADEVRVELATTAEGLALRALCHDPLPRVIHGLLKNPNTSTEHARLVAKVHHSSVGLGHIANNPRFLRDPEVQRQLLRNSHAGQNIVQKLIGNRPLLQVYRTAIDRNVPQTTRTQARKVLRTNWNKRDPNEKISFILKTEGRCLTLLVGMGLDGRCTAMLCSRAALGTMLIRNLAQWPSTPPPVLQRLMRLPQVGRDRMLKQLILKHPNCPSALKRGQR
jgi:hypothetical protein